jgi:osmotically-inducible protein OsmY
MEPRRRLAAPFLLALALALAPGCGPGQDVAAPPPSAEEAAAALESARREVEVLRAQVAERQQATESAEAQRQAAEAALEEAAEAYDQASNALRDAEQKLAALVPPPPSDAEVFRRVQKQLLDEPALARVAIKAEVAERKVTLYGNVPDEATRDAALAIARTVDGVASVESRIRVGAP